MKKICSILIVILALAHGAFAAVIISDNFNTTNTGVNDDLATRQSGSAATQNWTVGGNGTVSIASNVLSLDPSGNTSDLNPYLDYDLAAASGLLDNGAFKISFDMSANSNYSGLFIGDNNLGSRPVPLSNNDFRMLIKSTAASNVYVDGSSVSTAALGTGWQSWELTFTTSNFSIGTAFTASLTIDDTPYDLNGGAAGTSASGTWDGGSQYFGFSSRTSDTFVDNFQVEAIPEPASMGLLIGALVLLRLRRRAR